MRFLADAMLHRLCKWLRLLGHYCEYATSDKKDDEVIRLASRKKLVLLTRDEELAHRAGDYCRTLLLKSNDFREQAKAVFKAMHLKPRTTPSRTICPECNSRLRKVAKAGVEGRVWPHVFKHRRDFWECRGCGRIYWKGSHWTGIKKTLGKIVRR